jgi:hypothetical protein
LKGFLSLPINAQNGKKEYQKFFSAFLKISEQEETLRWERRHLAGQRRPRRRKRFLGEIKF